MAGKIPDISEIYQYGLYMQALWKLFNRSADINSSELIPQKTAQFNAVIRKGLNGESNTDVRTVTFHFTPYLNREGSTLGIEGTTLRNQKIKSSDLLAPFYYKDGDVTNQDDLITPAHLFLARENFTNETIQKFKNMWRQLQKTD